MRWQENVPYRNILDGGVMHVAVASIGIRTERSMPMLGVETGTAESEGQ
jgi:hypothetical protein